jgi:hypothetical protein
MIRHIHVHMHDARGKRFVVVGRVTGGSYRNPDPVTQKRNGQIVYYETREEAEAEARKMNARSSGGSSGASFSYWVEPE